MYFPHTMVRRRVRHSAAVRGQYERSEKVTRSRLEEFGHGMGQMARTNRRGRLCEQGQENISCGFGPGGGYAGVGLQPSDEHRFHYPVSFAKTL